jgi:hypothetical protein
MTEETFDIAGVVRGIRRRAAFARLSALIIIAVLTAIGIATVLVFLQFWNVPTLVIGPGTDLAQAQIKIGGELDWIQELTKAFIRIGLRHNGSVSYKYFGIICEIQYACGKLPRFKS